MRRNLIYQFFRNLVIMSPQKDTGGINAFSVYNGTGDFDKEAFGKGYDDFLNGYVWLRDWVAAQADKNYMKSEYPVLGIGNKTIQLKTLDDDPIVCGSYQLVLVSPLECSTCKENRSIQDIESDSFLSLTGLLKKLTEANLYSYLKDEVETTNLLTEEMLTYLVDEAIITDVEKLADITVISDFNLTALPEWGVHKLYGYTVTITVCYCEEIDFEFSYNVALWDKAVTKCASC